MNTRFNHTLIATIATLMLSTAFSAVAQDSNLSTNDYRWNIELGASLDFLQTPVRDKKLSKIVVK